MYKMISNCLERVPQKRVKDRVNPVSKSCEWVPWKSLNHRKILNEI